MIPKSLKFLEGRLLARARGSGFKLVSNSFRLLRIGFPRVWEQEGKQQGEKELTCWFLLLDLPALSRSEHYVYCLMYKPAWHLDLFRNPGLPYNKAIRRRHWKNTLNNFWNLQPIASTKQYLVNIPWTYGETFPSPLKFTSPRPYPAPPETNEQAWHVEWLWKIYPLVPYKNLRSTSTGLASCAMLNMSFPMKERTLKIGTKFNR